ncbi:uncharacterized protein BKA55DRAFT_536215 [Fusarium redolens]|uniref:Uncharacterized protein n=1 Tax=Fusarium redolens TaxID=48865 RepID=A0A9P9KL64_FUSRE|nr:uncharacterized protein BKA55DRAFT_536215 [Fusarium redolens]KAH7261206.1 hypothetical protein BKA55DRAFT_536215 [Fusarium redolens]
MSISPLCSFNQVLLKTVIQTTAPAMAHTGLTGSPYVICGYERKRHKSDQMQEENLEKGLRRFVRSFGQDTLSINSRDTESYRLAVIMLDQEVTQEEADIEIGIANLMVHKRQRTMVLRGDMSNNA